MRWRRALQAWRLPDHAVRFREAIEATGHEAVFWETSASRGPDSRFTQVFLPAPVLTRPRADPRAFRDHLHQPINAFDNLGGDAVLIAPSPAPGSFAHLASFARTAELDLQRELWHTAADQIERWWGARRGPLWVSTHGAGVPWLHLRLDSRPKYYTSPLVLLEPDAP